MAAKGQYFDDRPKSALAASAQPCGCDPGAKWFCKEHRSVNEGGMLPAEVGQMVVLPQLSIADAQGIAPLKTATPKSLFPLDDKGRKDLPVWEGVVMYFPRAIREVARVSKVGNDQHNPGQPLHWAKGKSTNQSDTAMRHKMDHALGNHYDTDGCLHQAKVCWRELAALETFLEQLESK